MGTVGAPPTIDRMERGPARLGRYIERLRLQRGWTQRDLAARAGINPSYLSAVEAGQRTWPKAVMPQIARALEVHEAFFAYEAGVLTENPATLMPADSFVPDDPRAEIVALLRRLPANRHQPALDMLRAIEDYAQGRDGPP